MKKIFCTIILIICCINSCIASPKVFTLQKDNKVISLFGTIHLTKSEWLPLPKNITDTLDKADALGVEIDLTDNNNMKKITNYMLTKGRMSEINLDIVLTDDERDKMQSTLGELSYAMIQMRPWIVAITIAEQKMKKAGFTDESIDNLLAEKAKLQKKKVISIETVEEQFDIFDNLSEQEQIDYLRNTLNQKEEEVQEGIQKIILVWQNNDENTAKDLLEKSKKENLGLYQNMFTKRNKIMTERIQKLNKQSNNLIIAVGALHLYGNNGIIQQLQDNGYQLIN